MSSVLRYFHVCNGGLLPDIMHDLLEGVLQYEMKLMLQEMIRVEKYFTLDEFNSRLSSTELGYMESKDKPTRTTLMSQGHSQVFYMSYHTNCLDMYVSSCTNVAIRTYSSSGYWRFSARR